MAVSLPRTLPFIAPRMALAMVLPMALPVTLGGCMAGGPPSLAHDRGLKAPVDQAGPLVFTEQAGRSTLRPKDRINLIVDREPQLSLAAVAVDEDGGFDAPAIGRVQAAGRSTEEVAAEVRSRLAREQLVDPRVSVNVADYGSHLVTVEGAVTQPGLYPFPPGTTLLGALALARGPLRVARRDQVAVFRGAGPERSVAVFDLDRVRAGEMVDPRLEPGDRVLIGFSGLGQAWQDFLSSAPLVALFTRF